MSDTTTPAYTALPALRIGQPWRELPTPSLVLDAAAFERNLDRMQAAADAHGLALRPHAKAHKCPPVALAQIARGAVGICCQKASEALPFLQAGVRSIHVSNQLASAAQAGWLARWAREGAAQGLRLSVCVDDAQQVAVLARAVAEQGGALDVLVEIDIGQGRCGVADAEHDASPVLRLTEQIGAAPGLRFGGLQAYHGGVQHARDAAQRGAQARAAAERAGRVVAQLQRAGAAPAVVTGSGTGSVAWDLASGVYTELQPGSYAFMDRDYADNEAAPAESGLAFEHALFLASSVVSVAADTTQVVLDCGLKTLSAESGPPRPWPPRPGCSEPMRLNDEHGLLRVDAGHARPALGERLLLIPGHCDPTFNLHDTLVLLRDERVEALWPIAARGLSW